MGENIPTGQECVWSQSSLLQDTLKSKARIPHQLSSELSSVIVHLHSLCPMTLPACAAAYHICSLETLITSTPTGLGSSVMNPRPACGVHKELELSELEAQIHK